MQANNVEDKHSKEREIKKNINLTLGNDKQIYI